MLGPQSQREKQRTQFHVSFCLVGADLVLFVGLCVEARSDEGPAQSDAEINRRDRCRTVCRLIFRGDPCTILGSHIISVSDVGPQIPIRDEKPRQSAM